MESHSLLAESWALLAKNWALLAEDRALLAENPACSAKVLIALLLCGVLAGCNSTRSSAPVVTATPNVAVTAVELEGGWGLASYRNETDRPRTEKEAKAACGNPYVVGKGANGGVMMHLADQTEPQEVFLKVAADGNVFIGPRGPAGVKQDRHIVSFTGGVWVADWMDPSAKERYGTMLFVRCGVPA